jgi:hypothetical protein
MDNLILFKLENQCILQYRLALTKQRFDSGNGSICSYHQKKYFQNVKKFQTKSPHVYLDILCEHAKFCGKPIFLCLV